jgi:hypothetical protein
MKNDKRLFLLYFEFCSLRFKVRKMLTIFELFIDILIFGSFIVLIRLETFVKT